MPTVETPTEAYQDLDRIRQRLDYEPDDFFSGGNAELEFDELLVEFEEESRGIFETLWGDQTPLTETARVDTKQATDDAAIPLVYPINDVTKVEVKRTLASEWDTLDEDWYTHTDHRLILSNRPNTNTLRRRQRGNSLTDTAERTTWGGLAEKLRVTYDRGFGSEPPADILSIQVQLINNMCRARKREQTVAAASPEEFAGQTETNEIVTDEIRSRVSDVTKPGRATMSI
jgi:hypothetical protein